VNRLFSACASVVLAGLGVASAQAQVAASPAPSEVVSTVPAKPAASSADTDAQIADWLKGAPLSVSDGDDGVITTGQDRGIHGEAGAFVSNRGYGGYVAATMPVGENGTLGVAVGDEHYSGRYFRGDARSVAASLALGPAATQHAASCPGGVRVGDHYVEPVWASQMRDAPLSDDARTCFTPPAANGR
jgi:hypothetical protein